MTKPKGVPPEERLDLLIDPIDYLILQLLPEEGTLAFGAYQTGLTVRELAIQLHKQKLVEVQLPSSTLSSRVRVLAMLKLAVKHTGLGTGSKHVWQRTPKGKGLYEQWRDHGNDS